MFETFFLCSFFTTQIDRDGSGYIELAELKQALDLCGFKIPSYQVRRMIEEVDRDQSGPGKGRLSFDEFEDVTIFPDRVLNTRFCNGIFLGEFVLSCAPS